MWADHSDGVYDVPRAEIRDTLHQFTRHPSVEMLEQQLGCHALKTYAEKNIDFVDAILLAHHQLHGDVVETFDRKLINLLNQH